MSETTMRSIGWILTTLAGLFLLMDAAGKLLAPAMMIANSPPLGLPNDEGFHRMLGAILAVCLTLYLYPRTAVLGAVLISGYLGGAIATHLRAGSPLFGYTLFGFYVGSVVWAGLWLRSPALRRLVPLMAEN